MKFKNLVGKCFGRLSVLSIYSKGPPRITYWCACLCGNGVIVRANNLTSGNTKSCGCLGIASRITHGMSGNNPTYRSWENMKERVRRGHAGHKAFKYYSDVSVCSTWDEFENFFADMGERPAGRSLDRKDGNKHYGPDNCRWATPAQQSRNTRTKPGVSGHRGVLPSENGKKWLACIFVKRKRIHLGTFETLQNAVVARKKAEQAYWGDEC